MPIQPSLGPKRYEIRRYPIQFSLNSWRAVSIQKRTSQRKELAGEQVNDLRTDRSNSSMLESRGSALPDRLLSSVMRRRTIVELRTASGQQHSPCSAASATRSNFERSSILKGSVARIWCATLTRVACFQKMGKVKLAQRVAPQPNTSRKVLTRQTTACARDCTPSIRITVSRVMLVVVVVTAKTIVFTQ